MLCPHCGEEIGYCEMPVEDMVISERLDDGSFKEWRLSFTWVSVPSGATGYRLEYLDEGEPFTEDVGTLTVMKGKAVVVQW